MSTIVHYTPAQNPTVKAQVDLKAGTFVQIAGTSDGRNPVVKPAVANAQVFGVPATDAAKGGYVMVYRAGHIVEVEASGSIAAGDLVVAAASGKAAKASWLVEIPESGKADGSARAAGVVKVASVVGQAVSDAVNNRVLVALK